MRDAGVNRFTCDVLFDLFNSPRPSPATYKSQYSAPFTVMGTTNETFCHFSSNSSYNYYCNISTTTTSSRLIIPVHDTLYSILLYRELPSSTCVHERREGLVDPVAVALKIRGLQVDAHALTSTYYL